MKKDKTNNVLFAVTTDLIDNKEFEEKTCKYLNNKKVKERHKHFIEHLDTIYQNIENMRNKNKDINNQFYTDIII